MIAAIGFVGSYAAVRELAQRKGFGAFATVFPIGVDAGIAVLLSLDLLLTWMRIPFPLLRQAAWLLTGATIAFNAAAAWPDPVGVGMHGVIPLLFVVTVEAARHAVGRLAAITADQYMEGVRLWRWLLAPLPTFKLWRRMMLWEIRKYEDGLQAERQRLVYQAHLRSRHGRGWRWKAPVEDLLPLRIARYGVPLEVASRPRSREYDEDLQGVHAVRPSDADERVETEVNSTGPADRVPLDMSPPRSDEAAVGRRLQATAAPEGSAAVAEPAEAEVVEHSADAEQGGPRMNGVDDPGPPADAASEAEQPAAADTDQSDGRSLDDLHGTGPEQPEPASEEASESEKDEAVLVGLDGGVEQAADTGEIEPPEESGDQDHWVSDGSHAETIAAMKSNAAAVRYAMDAIDSTHTPTVVDWLTKHGRTVNRGQAHKIMKEAEEHRRAKLVKATSEPGA